MRLLQTMRRRVTLALFVLFAPETSIVKVIREVAERFNEENPNVA